MPETQVNTINFETLNHDSAIQFSGEVDNFGEVDDHNETFINSYLLNMKSNTPLSVILEANNIFFDNSFMQ